MSVRTFSGIRDVLPRLILLLSLGWMGVVGAASATPSTPVRPDTSQFLGDWVGTLTVGGTDLRVVFRLKRGQGESVIGTMDSPDQGATDIPIGTILVDRDTLRLEVPSIAGAYAGILTDEGATLKGQWVQGGRRFPLRLERTKDAPTVRRPQEPTMPYPYESEVVTFRNEAAGVTLTGTLTRPRTDDPVPAVVLVAGAGPNDRNATVMGHEPFLVLADALTRRGLAVLRFDERGVGASEGSQEDVTMADFSGDVGAAVTALAHRSGIRSHEIGIIGHSQGGLIASLAARDGPDVSFLVLLATPGFPGDVLLADQLDRRIREQGASRRIRALQRGTQKHIFDILKQDADSAEIASQLRKIMIQSRGISGERTINREIQRLMDPWLRFYISHDPRTVLRNLELPVLALAGSKDQEVAPDTNQTAIAEALNADGRPEVTVRTLEGLNHLFQTAETGSPSEYGRIEETFDPAAIDVIAQWIDDQIGLTEPSPGE